MRHCKLVNGSQTPAQETQGKDTTYNGYMEIFTARKKCRQLTTRKDRSNIPAKKSLTALFQFADNLLLRHCSPQSTEGNEVPSNNQHGSWISNRCVNWKAELAVGK
jgi:hypothetical protein